MGIGVIGNTADFDSAISGSNPESPANFKKKYMLVTVKSFDDAMAAIAETTFGVHRESSIFGLSRRIWNISFIADKKYYCNYLDTLYKDLVVEIYGQRGYKYYIPWVCVQNKTGNTQLLKEEFCKRKICL